MKTLIYKEDLLAEYDRAHVGPPGGARKLIAEATAVDAVEVVHGEWVHHYHDSGEPIDDKWYCSECHMCNDHKRTWYCPNCGAKMDGVKACLD